MTKNTCEATIVDTLKKTRFLAGLNEV